MTKLDIKDFLDRCIYRIYNGTRYLLYGLRYFKIKPIIKRNEVFKNKYYGERCFILGNGPSLKGVDLTFLKDKYTFVCNFFTRTEQFGQFNPSFYVLMDTIWFTDQNHISYMKTIISKCPNSSFFVKGYGKHIFDNSYMDISNIYFTYNNLCPIDDRLKFDYSSITHAGFNIIPECIGLACFMGFKEIILLGCDFNSFATVKPLHSYNHTPEEEKRLTVPLGYELKRFMLACYAHYAINQFAQKHGIKILNATEGSLLDAYQRVQLNDIG